MLNRVLGMYTVWNYLFIMSTWVLQNQQWSYVVGANTVLIALMVTFCNAHTDWDCVRGFYTSFYKSRRLPEWFWIAFDGLGHILPLLFVNIPGQGWPYAIAWCMMSAWYYTFNHLLGHIYRPYTRQTANSSYAFTTVCVVFLLLLCRAPQTALGKA